MTKNKKIVSLMVVSFALLFFVKKAEQNHVVDNRPANAPLLTVKATSESKFIDKNRRPIDRLPASTSYVNTPSVNWEKHLRTSLAAQGGSGLKDIKIKKEKSLVWMRDENPLHVESVVVTLTNKQNVEASFRALVDSQTGKVIESWDQSVFDPANVRGSFRIKLDPRYTN
jgi:hypothetical protein